MQKTEDPQLLSEIEWFNGELDRLARDVKDALESAGHEVNLQQETTTQTEQLSGTYETKRFVFDVDGEIEFTLVPNGIWIIGGKGRADLLGPSGSEKLVYLSAGGPSAKFTERPVTSTQSSVRQLFEDVDEDGWYWYDDSPSRRAVKLTSDVLESLLDRVS